MSRNNNTVPCTEQLRKLLYIAGVSLQGASSEMGKSRCYLSYALKHGKLSRSAAKTLELLYGIKPEEYAPEEPKEEPEDDLLKKIDALIARVDALLAKMEKADEEKAKLDKKLDALIRVWEG